ncbi:uncharacterized protein LOC128227834 isoform X1 [Mya arenaria]|uniref:uncharacterized protein LOC128227834 isoform X1 n=2 Tax=Mya arenaria TaxID=6604 RepID=UPI0022E8937F|nr:uncharacterized protein LOC128227834 isoform X1 [Mya arenaria]
MCSNSNIEELQLDDRKGLNKFRIKMPKVYQVNLQEFIEEYAWDCFKQDIGFIRRLFNRKSKFYFDIRWGYLDFSHRTESKERPVTGNVNQKNEELYYSEYDNKTSTQQNYTFSTSRETTATTSIELQENYTIGAETNLEVDLAGIVKFGGGVNGSLSVTETKSQEFSKTLTWNIDTNIVVPRWNRARATLLVYEQPSILDFTVTTTLSLPKKTLPVSLRRKRDDKIVKTYYITNLNAIFAEYNKKYATDEDRIVKIETRPVEGSAIDEVIAVITSHGTCKNVSWKKQHVKVQCTPIEGAPPEAPVENKKEVSEH